jgi:hypothetical protein
MFTLLFFFSWMTADKHGVSVFELFSIHDEILII